MTLISRFSKHSLVAVLGVAFALAGAACDDSGGTIVPDSGAGGSAGTDDPALLTINPNPGEFGSIVIGASAAQQVFQVSNGSGSPSGMLLPSIEGPDAALFKILATSTCGPALAGGNTCQITVSFAPDVAGLKSALLRVRGKGTELAEANLSGTGVNPAAFAIAPPTSSLGSVVIGQESGPLTLTVTNTGGVASGVPVVTLVGADPAHFSVAPGTCTAALPPGGTCTIEVRFKPTTVLAKSAIVNVTAGAAMGTASVSGIGVPVGNLTISPSPKDYSGVLVNKRSTAQFTVKNTGFSESKTLTQTIAGTNPGEFGISGTTCGTTLAAGATCTIDVDFAPKTAGAHTALLQVSGEPGGTAQAALQGLGLNPAAIAVLPATQDFGSVVAGEESAAVTFTVSNNGDVPTTALTVSKGGDNATEFVITSDGCGVAPIAARSTCTLQVKFRPAAGATGSRSATLTVAAATGGTSTSNMSGQAILPGQIAIGPSPHNFGGIALGKSSVPVSFTVTNSGQAATGPLVVAFSGAHPADFPITPNGNGCTGVSLAAGTTCTITLNFTPTALDVRGATLTVAGNPGGATQAILSGTGLSSATLVSTPPNRDFGSVVVGLSSNEVVFLISNTGQVSTGPLNAVLTGAEALNFKIVNSACNNQVLGTDGSTCAVTVTFNPVAILTKIANLEVGDGSAKVVVPLTGLGQNPASLLISPSSPTIASVVDDEVGAGIEFTLQNLGDTPSGNLTFAFTGNTADFELVPNMNFCPVTGIASGLSCKLWARFVPKSPGNKSASLNVTSATAGNTSASLQATALPKTTIQACTGETCADIANPELFGQAPAGIANLWDEYDTTHPTYHQTFEVTCHRQAGCGPFTLTLGGANGIDWEVVEIIGCGSALALNASCNATVQYRPRNIAASKTATLTFGAADADQNLVINLGGSSRSPIHLFYSQGLTAERDYGQVIIGNMKGLTYDVLYEPYMPNPSGRFSTFMTGANPGPFLVTNGSCLGQTLAGNTSTGSMCAFDTALVPSASVAYAATLNIQVPVTNDYPTNNNNPASANTASTTQWTDSLNIKGSGIPGPKLEWQSSSTTAIATPSGTDSALVTVTFRNAPGVIQSGALTPGVTGGPLVAGFGGTCTTANNVLDASETCTITFTLDSTPPPGVMAGTFDVTLCEAIGGGCAARSIGWTITSQLVVTPSPGVFGSHPSGATKDVTFTVTNVSATPVAGVSYTLPGVGNCTSTQFTLVPQQTTCGQGTIAAGGSCSIVVRFTAADQGYGSDECKVLRVTNVGSIVSVDTSLTATNLGRGVLLFVPGGDRYFGAANTRTVPMVIKVRNDGSFASGALSTTFGNPNEFLIDTMAATPAGETRCVNGVTSLGAGDSCVYLVVFFPDTGSQSFNFNRSSTFEVTGANGGDTAGPIDLFGHALNQNDVTISPSQVDFGPEVVNAAAGTTASIAGFTVLNSTGGVANLLPRILNLGDDSLNTNFSVVACGSILQGVADCGPTLADGAACRVCGAYTPKSGASGTPHAARLSVVSGGQNTFAALQGRVLTPAAFTLTPFDDEDPLAMTNDGTVTVGVAADREFTLTNTGDVPGTINTITQAGANAGEYSFPTTCAGQVVQGGDNCKFKMRLLATSGNFKLTTMSITHTGSNATITQAMSSWALVAPSLAISPDAPTITGTSPGNSTPVTGVSQTLVLLVENSIFGAATGALTFSLSDDDNFMIDWNASTCDQGMQLGLFQNNFTCNVAVRHTPVTSGITQVTLQQTILTVTDGSVSATETIKANVRPAVTITPATGTFNAPVNGFCAGVFDVRLDNDADTATTLMQTKITGTDVNDFGINLNDFCGGTELQTESRTFCQLGVGFVPLDANPTSKAGKLELKIVTTDNIDISVSAVLQGTVGNAACVPFGNWQEAQN